ncbi:MAG: AsmA family protein [Cohaesibacter sp.]|nr:AsmA family protein [Cohaesibacter sp.]
MRKFLIISGSLFGALFLLLLIAPFFLSTDLLKNQVQTFVKEQTGMSLQIKGPVALSLITGLELSAQNVSLQDKQGSPLFDVEELDFALALSPLLQGQADIRAITLNSPVLTIATKKNTTQTTAEDDPIRALAQEQSQDQQGSQTKTEEIDLSSLRLQRLSLRKAKIISLDEDNQQSTILEQLDADIQIPDFNGPATFSASLLLKGQTQQIEGRIAHISNVVNGKQSRITLNATSALQHLTLDANLALQQNVLLSGNLSVKTDTFSQAMHWLSDAASPFNAEKASLTASFMASKQEVQLRSINAQLDEQILTGAARFFPSSPTNKALLRLALDMESLNLDKLVSGQKASNATNTSESTNQANTTRKEQTPDLSALTTFNATLDLRIQSLIAQGAQISKIKLLANLVDGKLQSNLTHASLAKGTLSATIDGIIEEQIWSGSVKAQKLDVPMLAKLANQQSPLQGMASANITFKAKGMSAQSLQQSANLAGTISLEQGNMTMPALQAAIPTRKSGQITNLSLLAKLNGLKNPVALSGRLNWNGEQIAYESRLNLSQLLARKATATSLTIKSAPLIASLSGTVSPANISLSGSKIAFSSPSSKALMRWLGQEVTSGTPDLPLTMQANLALSPTQTSLDQLVLGFGQSKANGTLSIANAQKPFVKANLAFDKLDVTPFMGDGGTQGRTGSASSGADGTSPSPTQGWDTKAIDFAPLHNLDAEFNLSAKSLIARNIVTSNVTLIAKLRDGQLQASLDQIALYQGTGTGGITLNAKTKPAQISANFSLDQMQMAYFLRDALGVKSLSGRGSTKLALTTQGASQADLINNLNGNTNLVMRDGQIKGINIPQMLRSLQGNILEGWASSQSQSTDFSALQASFAIQNGMATNEDLQMLSPLLRLSGAGQIDLPAQRINYKAIPKLVSKLRGQGGLVNADGLPIPIIIKGKLTKPRIYPDLPGILENPQAVLQGLRNLGGTGKAAAKGLERLDKTITKELDKQSQKLGIDLNKLLRPQNQQQGQPAQSGQPAQPQQQPTQQPIEQQLFNNITKGLFGN